MSLSVANWVVAALAAYLAAGVCFAGPFLLVGVGRIDPAARAGTWGFRILIAPGVVLLWPVLLRRWATGRKPEEASPHRLTGRRS